MNTNEMLYRILTTKCTKELTQTQAELLKSLDIEALKNDDDSTYNYYKLFNKSTQKVIVISKNRSNKKAMFSPWWQINNSDKNITKVDILGFLNCEHRLKNNGDRLGEKISEYKRLKWHLEYHSNGIKEAEEKLKQIEKDKQHHSEKLAIFKREMNELLNK